MSKLMIQLKIIHTAATAISVVPIKKLLQKLFIAKHKNKVLSLICFILQSYN